MAYDAHDYVPPEREWLLLTGQTGLVFAPRVMADRQLIPEPQTAADNAAVQVFLDDSGRLTDAWGFCRDVLSWPADRILGAPDQDKLPADLGLMLAEHNTLLEPHWGVRDRNGDWQVWVRIESQGIGPDQRGALPGWEATPAQRFERLLRERQVPAGVLITDHEIRLIHAPRGETSGWINWRPIDLTKTAGRPMLGGLKMVLGRHRLFTAPAEESLPALLRESRRAQETVSTALAQQVLGALHELLRGYVAAEPEAARALAARDPHHLYEGLLTVLMRLVFVLYAEDRSLLPSSADGDLRALYEQNYSVRGLLDQLDADAALYPDTMDERIGGWGRLLALFRLIHAGKGDWIAGRGGKLFDPGAFPFLEGRAEPGDAPSVMRVSDGCLYRVLSGLMRLDGERLSYRTLDVEQIGSVYETVMGFTVEVASGPSIAIRAGKKDRTPVFVDLEALLREKGSGRLKWLKTHTERSKFPGTIEALIQSALSTDDLHEAFVRGSRDGVIDERGSPGGEIAPSGTPILQPTDERRRSGSHYTPRSLTEPIVRHALKPAFDRLGERPTPEQVLSLKVCDPAMGSGAFLVEACRQIGEKLEEAYQTYGVPTDIPPDEDLTLYTKRRVAQVCIYGVDRNPMATDLARLSMWLLTLARDHEFAFLDHALKTGDSLVGLTLRQIEAAHWDDSQAGHAILRTIVRDKVREALVAREAVRNAPESARVFEQVRRNRSAEAAAATVRTIGDAVIAAFFAGDKTKVREEKRREVEQAAASSDRVRWNCMAATGAELREGKHGFAPFHWEVEFPEVFLQGHGGFDAVVGNPPFLGGSRVWAALGTGYPDWIRLLHEDSGGKAVDLVAHFFRRAFDLTHSFGTIGLIATKTIAEGDTRVAGLEQILNKGGLIYRAETRIPWPGEASVIVSAIHIARRPMQSVYLDGVEVRELNSFLTSARVATPARLQSNARLSFRGSDVYGDGFIFSDEGRRNFAGTTADLKAIRQDDPLVDKVIKPYLGGKEITTDPTHSHSRWVINFGAMSLAEAGKWPLLLSIVEEKVKPQRSKLDGYAVAIRRRDFWWQFGTYAAALDRSKSALPNYIVCSQTTSHIAFAIISSDVTIGQKAIGIVAQPIFAIFAVLSSRVHEVWALCFGGSQGQTPVYSPVDCFETFPLPRSSALGDLEAAGQTYNALRAQLMIDSNEGLTKTYNRFHDAKERGTGIQRLRELHAEMDRAVLEAYSRDEPDPAKAAVWRDLAARARPEFIEQETDAGKRVKSRLDWPQAFKDELLERLLDLNAERAAAEKAGGLVAASEDDAAADED